MTHDDRRRDADTSGYGDATRTDRAVSTALHALRQAQEDASGSIEQLPDAQMAFERATELAEAARKYAESAADLRTQMVARIWETERLSLASLASKIGVSKARADQMIRAARNTRATKGGADDDV